MNLNIKLPSPIMTMDGGFIGKPTETKNNISILCKRDDLIHPIISGNKWRKLSATLAYLKQSKSQGVISFGGAYSNHLHALSYACMYLNIQLTAVVRGNYEQSLTPTLIDMLEWGTKLHYVTKVDYQQRANEAYCQRLKSQFNADHVIPEGGSSKDALQGVGRIIEECSEQAPDITHIVLPVASGGTLAGLLSSPLLPKVKLVGIGVLKGEGYLEGLVQDLLLPNSEAMRKNKQWQILHSYHHGGYAKTSADLLQFVSQFNQNTNQLNPPNCCFIEPVYSGKCFFALDQLIKANFFPNNSKILLLHTGGIQGARKAQ
jgi:1-aminocyclopropane-1-carboxylate deaminase